MSGDAFEDFRARLARVRVVPVIRTASPDLARRACSWLLDAGMDSLELTFTTPGAAEIIREFAGRPGVLIGAGTVRTVEQARTAAAAGAAFLVSPGAAPEVAAEARRLALPFLPGAATPSEVSARWAEGAAVVKVFPARECGGPGFLKAVKSVFPEIPLMPTGGVSPDTVTDYLTAGALCVGMGGELTPAKALEANDPAPVLAAARRALEAAGR